MNTEELSDLAFEFVEITFPKGKTLLVPVIEKYIKEVQIEKKDIDYFLVFVKHWFDNRVNSQWGDVIFNISILTPS